MDFSEDELKQIFKIFKEECEEHLTAINKNLASAENNQNMNFIISELLREFHSIKGSSRMLNISSIQTIAHKTEDLLYLIKENSITFSEDVKQILYQAIDLISNILEKLKYDKLNYEETESLKFVNFIENFKNNTENSSENDADKNKENKQINSEIQNNKNDLISLNTIPVTQDFQTLTEKQTAKKNDKTANKKNVYSSYNDMLFKTIRVDTNKLDSIENLIEELIALKIKNKQNLEFLNSISDAMLDTQKKINKLMILAKSYDKKSMFENKSEIDYLTMSKKFGKHIFNLNEKFSNLYKTTEKFHKNFITDDTTMHNLTNTLSSMIKKIRILPLATIYQMFPRMVRDIAYTKHKQAEIVISGSETCADKAILEEIKTILIQIIRNSVDHGIESPDERIKKGKDPTGKIHLHSYNSSKAIVIKICDDGKGLDIEEIKAKALQLNLIKQEEINLLSENQIANLIFLPGFTTEEHITEISGRGIGLDVVHEIITKLDGKISIQSEKDFGLITTITIPITLSTMNVLLFKIQKQYYAIATNYVKYVKTISANEIIYKAGEPHIIFENTSLKLVKLSELLKINSLECSKDKLNVLIIQVEDKILAFETDEIIRTEEILQKKLNPPLNKIKNISGVSTLSNGEICFVLNPFDIMEECFTSNQLKLGANILNIPVTVKRIPNVLVVDDSKTTLVMLKNILKASGYNPILEIGAKEAIQKLAEMNIDIIITDINMPNMDGIELIKYIKSNNNKIPIIVLTSQNSDEVKQICLNIGASEYIKKKDFSESYLIKKINELII